MEQSALIERLSHLPAEPNPALLEHARSGPRAFRTGSRTGSPTFAGSMAFVYLHIVWFGCWIGFGVEKYPYGLLTMIVSLEAIFLSTFVMISQNRADAKRQVVADQQWRTVQEEDRRTCSCSTSRIRSWNSRRRCTTTRLGAPRVGDDSGSGPRHSAGASAELG